VVRPSQVSPTLAERELALVGATLLGVVVALAVAHRVGGSTTATTADVRPVISSLAAWNTALAEPRTAPRRRSACGWLLGAGTLGVAHPVLPCGAKLFIAFHGRRVLTQVVDRGPSTSAGEFQLTPALARELHFQGRQAIRWTFARA
jgi:hypothetical protein